MAAYGSFTSRFDLNHSAFFNHIGFELERCWSTLK